MKKCVKLACGATGLFLLLIACRPAAFVESGMTPVPSAKKVEAPAPKGDWERLVEAAQKEGTVIVYTTIQAKARDATRAAFKPKFLAILDTKRIQDFSKM